MTSLQDLFFASKGQPVVYNGTTVQMVDRLSVGPGRRLRLVFESVDSPWRQGVHLSTKGSFFVNGRECAKAVVLWQHTAPREVTVGVVAQGAGVAEVFIKNVWDVGDGVMHSWHNGAAMIVDDHGGGRRYRCNDGAPDDDFNDLVFTLQEVD